MNFLAHLYLSGDDPGIMTGNFIGDFVKGRNLAGRFAADVATGIELHRHIDDFTDNHPQVRQSKKRLHARYRHFSAVIVDIFYDHFLAANWNDFHTSPLHVYAAQAYRILEERRDSLPDDVNRMLPYMISGNWLVGYAHVEGIHRALSGIARRTKFVSHMEEASADLRQHYDEFKSEFDAFFPELKAFSVDFLERRRKGL